MTIDNAPELRRQHIPWNKGKVTGQKPPLKPREVWAIRVRLQVGGRVRELALFNLAIRQQVAGLRPGQASGRRRDAW